ncbi:MAG: hypothetical protein KDB32_11250 [Planctomycetes bacterium]|nr:hypothetical protein [Planctomycetota bacterium]
MKNLAMLGLLALLFCSPLFADDTAAYRKIESKLDSTTIDALILDETDIKEAVKTIARKAGISILFDKSALEGLSDDERKVTLELSEIKASNALNLVLDQLGLTKGYKYGFLYVMCAETVEEAVEATIYDVRDITANVKDFEAPKLKLVGEGDDIGGIVHWPEQDEDIQLEDIVELIEDSIDADWGDTASVTEIKGQLVVRASRSVHKEVASLLDQLRGSK